MIAQEYYPGLDFKADLKIANNPNTQFLKHLELIAIHCWDKYIEIEFQDRKVCSYGPNKNNPKYRDGKTYYGAGITIFKDGKKEIGEYSSNKLNGCGKTEWPNGDRYWGSY